MTLLIVGIALALNSVALVICAVAIQRLTQAVRVSAFTNDNLLTSLNRRMVVLIAALGGKKGLAERLRECGIDLNSIVERGDLS